LINQPLVDTLTIRELDVLELLGQRLQNKEITEKLFISPENGSDELKDAHGYHLYPYVKET
jgi:FixJ family two-component response regulator